jgi:predicted negative regulator of RcsB-dependent stress response
MAATNDQVLTAVSLLGRKIDALLQEAGILMSQQDNIDADVLALTGAVDTLTASAAAIVAEVAALKAANPALDLSALDAAVAGLSPAVQAIADIAPVPPAA